MFWSKSVLKALGEKRKSRSSKVASPLLSRSSVGLNLERLETRDLLAASPVSWNDGVINITGTDQADRVVITGLATTNYVVTINGNSSYFSGANVKRFEARLGNGDDYFENLTNVDCKVWGEAGNDTLVGGRGWDFIWGGAGRDRIWGRDGHDTLYGEEEMDELFGEGDNDWLYGGSGDDRLYGNNGNDALFGNAGNDYLAGGLGSDSTIQDDNVTYEAATGTVFVQGSNGNDTIQVGDVGPNLIVRFGGNEVAFLAAEGLKFKRLEVRGLGGNDSIRNDTYVPSALYGDGGQDTLVGGSAADWLYGGSENDRLYGNNGNDVLFGNAGNDYLAGGLGSDSTIQDDNVTYDVATGTVIVQGSNGNETLQVGDIGIDLTIRVSGREVAFLAANGIPILRLTMRWNNGEELSLDRTGNLSSARLGTLGNGVGGIKVVGFDREHRIWFLDQSGNLNQSRKAWGEDGFKLVDRNVAQYVFSPSGSFFFLRKDGLLRERTDSGSTIDLGTDVDPRYLSIIPAGTSSVSAILRGSVLTINGSENDDFIVVRQSNGRIFVENVAGSFDAINVRSINVNASGGNDFVSLQALSLGYSATIYGGVGSDYLHGGNGKDMIFGEDGNDRLDGGTGQDTFFGGEGRDTYHDEFNPTQWAVTGLTTDDVQQGTGGTCTILSTLASAAGNRQLGANISYLGNHKYRVVLFTRGLFGIGTYRTYQEVTFDGTWFDHDAQPTRQRDLTGAPTGAIIGDFWTTVYQRAVLQQRGVNWRDPQTMETWGWYQNEAHYMILGNENTIGFGNSLVSVIDARTWLKRGEVVTISTKSNTGNGLVRSHCYAVTDIYQNSSGQWRMRLYNPWGTDNGLNGQAVAGSNDGRIDIAWGDSSFDTISHSV